MHTSETLFPKLNGLFCHAFRIALIGAILISAQAAWGADPGVPVPPGQWTFVLTRGLPAAANGWEQLVYAPIIKRSIMLAFYHQRNSEPNESLVAYNFESNSWDVLDMGGNFHTENIPEGGESQGYFDFNPNNNTIIYHCCTTGSNQPENVNHTWWYDVLGQSGRDKHTSPKPSQQALQPGGAFDAAHNVFVVHGGDSFVGTWSYDPTANTWRKMNPSGTLPDPSLILPGLAYSTREQKMYLFGGLSTAGYYNDLYVYDYPTNTWAKVNPAGGVKPSARNRQAFAYDSTNNIFLMYGGQNSSGNLNDTWVYDPSANQWTQVNSPQNPPVPGTAIFAKLSYDSDHNVFVLAQLGTGGYYGGNWSAYAVQTWLFRYQGAGPNAGTVPVNDTRSAGALNRNTVSWAKDPALATDGTSLYVGWSEVGAPFDTTDAAWPHIFVSQYLAGSWVALGSTSTSVSSSPTKEAHSPSMAVVNGKPWASWYESDNAGNTAKVYAKNWDGAAWQGGAVGLNGTTTRLFQGQSQITGAGATPYVGVLEVDKDPYPQSTMAYVRSWNGASWSTKGGPLNRLTGAGSTALSISIAADGTTPYAAWSEYMHFADTGTGYDNDANPKIYVSSWNGTQWVAVGGTLNMDAAAGWAYDPSIAVLNGQLFVAWTERSQTGNTQVYVKMWNGSSWVLTGSGSLNHTPVAGWAYHPSLVADAAGNQLYMGWVEQAGLGQKAQVYMARYAAGVWSPLGGTLNADPVLGSAQRVSIGVFNNQPVAAWGEVNLGAVRGIYAKQWNGSSWTLLSGTGGPADIVAPSTPATPGAVGISSNQIRVVWGASADIVGVTGYYIYRGGVQIAEVTSTLNYIDTGLNPNTTYSYQIAAHDAAGNLTAKAGPVSATTFASPVGSGGSLSGSQAAPPATIQLTTEGTLDWAHWGLSSAAAFDHKAGASLISNYTAIGGPATQYTNNPSGFTWTGGTPTAAATNTTTGVYIGGYAEGFRVTAPADQTTRTLRVYVGVHNVQGRMVAQLSDGSAPDYTGILVENPSTPSTYGVFTFSYKAASAGQTLIVTFTQDFLTTGNVSLQAATLSGSAPPPDFSVSAAPASQTVAAGVPASYTVTASALSGFAGAVSFTVSGLPAGATAGFNPATVTGSGSTTLSVNTTAATVAGTYPLVVTATSGSLNHTAAISLTVTVPASGGVLSGSMLNPTGTVQLTTEGSSDWAHWGVTAVTDFNHKAAVTQQISNFVPLGGGTVARYANNAVGYSWTDGTPTASTTNSTTGIFVAGQGRGFQITAPADATLRTLKVYVGAWRSQGRFLAHLSDGSVADYLDTSLSNSAGATSLGVYTLTYKAASNAQTLTVTYTMNSGTGNVTLQAATLAGGIATPDFTVAATPPSQSVVAGSNAGYSVTIGALNGFNAAVGFSVSGLPSGVTADFNPSTVTGSGSSALTLTTSAATALGAYPLTLTATSGSLSHTANISLTVTGPPDFTVAATPPSQNVVAGSNAGYTVTIGALNGFNAAVGFSVSGLPSGVTAGFTPSTVTGSGSSALTLTTTAAAAPGTYPLTVTATAGSLAHTANISLTVTAAPDFTVAATPPSQNVVAGSNAGFTVTIGALNGFNAAVGFSVSGLPSGVTAGFNPSTVTGSGSSTLTLTTTAAAAPGTYPLTVTATSGSLSHTANISLTVAAAPDFTVAATPPSQSAVAGSNASYTVTIGALNGFNASTGFSVSGLPSGVTSGFNPSTVTGSGSSTLTLTTTAAAAPGTYPLTVTATAGSLSHTANISLTVTAAPNFTVAATPPSQSVVAGSNAGYTVTIGALNGFNASTGFSVSGLPSGVTSGFNPSTVTGSGSSTLTLTTTAAAAPGTYPLTVTATAGSLSHTANISLTVTGVPDFTVAATPPSQSILTGSGAAYTVTTGALNGFNASIGFSVSGLPASITAGFNPSTITGSGSSILTLTASAAASPGTYPLTVTATAGSLSHTANISLTVTIPASGGGLNGSFAAPAGTVQLTNEGSSDWAHWGLAATADFNHKAAVTQQINYSNVGAGIPSRYANNSTGFTWTDGTPTPAATNSTTGIFVSGANNGFRVTAPASGSVQTLKVYVGAWRTQGQLIAHLSDGSAADYTDSSLSNTVGATSLRVYTLTYRSATAGQTLTVTFTNMTGSGNVTLQAATLSAPTPDFTAQVTPSSQSIAVGGSGAYTVNVTALNLFSGTVGFNVTGLPTGVTAGFSPTNVTASGNSTMTLNVAAGTTPGTYPLVLTATSGSLSHTANFSVTIPAVSSGLLSGAVATPSGPVQLTTTGISDWAHWGTLAVTDFDHKAGVTPLISNYTLVGTGNVSRFPNNPVGYTWTDGGAPNSSATNTTTGIFTAGLGGGFRITVPADTTPRTVKIYVGAWNSQGKLVAHLSDASAADYTDTSLVTPPVATSLGVYTLTYRAASAGQTLTITFTQNSSSGNVTLQAATLAP